MAQQQIQQRLLNNIKQVTVDIGELVKASNGCPQHIRDSVNAALNELNTTATGASRNPDLLRRCGDIVEAWKQQLSPNLKPVFVKTLSTSDKQGTTLASHLQDLSSNIADEKAFAVLRDSLIRASGRSAYSSRNDDPMAGLAESCIYALAVRNISEFTRISRSLMETGRISLSQQIITGSGTTRIPFDLVVPSDLNDSRIWPSSIAGRALETSLKAALAGPDHTYDVKQDELSPSDPTKPTLSGMRQESAALAISVLSGEEYGELRVANQDVARRALSIVRDLSGHGEPILVVATLTQNGKLYPVTVTRMAEEATRGVGGRSQTNSLVHFYQPSIDGRSNPLRLESLPESSFFDAVQSILLPKRSIPLGAEQLRNRLNATLTSPHHKDLLAGISTDTLKVTDSNGFSVANNLSRICLAYKSDPNLQEMYIEAILERIAHPGTSTQDRHGTCGAESILRLMNITDLGEYSRIAADILILGRSKLRNGMELHLPSDWAKPDKSTNRHLLDAHLQATLMQAAVPNPFWEYSNQHDQFINRVTRETKEAGYGCEKALDVVNSFAISRHSYVLGDQLSSKQLTGLLSKVSESAPVYTVLKWPVPTDRNGAHAVLVKKIENGRVYFSNPQGPSGKPTGHIVTDNGPRHRIEDDGTGYQSMSFDEFRRNLIRMMMEESVIAANTVQGSTWWPTSLWSFVSRFSIYGWASFGLLSVGTTFGGRELERNNLQPWSGTPLTDVIQGATDVLSDPSALARIPLPDFGSWFAEAAEAPKEETPKTPPSVVPAATVHVPTAVTGAPSTPLDLKIRDNLLEVQMVLRKANVPTPRIDASSKKLLEETVASFYTAVDTLPPFHPHKHKLLAALGDVKDKGIGPEVVAEFERIIIESCQPNR